MKRKPRPRAVTHPTALPAHPAGSRRCDSPHGIPFVYRALARLARRGEMLQADFMRALWRDGARMKSFGNNFGRYVGRVIAVRCDDPRKGRNTLVWIGPKVSRKGWREAIERRDERLRALVQPPDSRPDVTMPEDFYAA